MEDVITFIRSRKKMNLLMVAANLVVFIVLSILGNTESGLFMAKHGACFGPAVLNGEYYRIFTSMFLHFGIYHLLNNMVCLIFLGDMLETLVGPVRYLLIYLLGGLGGNLLSLALEIKKQEYAISAGASGAIFAVIGALLYIVIRNKGRVGTLTSRRLTLMVVLSVLQGFSDTGTDNAAHIGGFLCGFLLGLLLYRSPREPSCHSKEFF